MFNHTKIKDFLNQFFCQIFNEFLNVSHHTIVIMILREVRNMQVVTHAQFESLDKKTLKNATMDEKKKSLLLVYSAKAVNEANGEFLFFKDKILNELNKALKKRTDFLVNFALVDSSLTLEDPLEDLDYKGALAFEFERERFNLYFNYPSWRQFLHFGAELLEMHTAALEVSLYRLYAHFSYDYIVVCLAERSDKLAWIRAVLNIFGKIPLNMIIIDSGEYGVFREESNRLSIDMAKNYLKYNKKAHGIIRSKKVHKDFFEALGWQTRLEKQISSKYWYWHYVPIFVQKSNNLSTLKILRNIPINTALTFT